MLHGKMNESVMKYVTKLGSIWHEVKLKNEK